MLGIGLIRRRRSVCQVGRRRARAIYGAMKSIFLMKFCRLWGWSTPAINSRLDTCRSRLPGLSCNLSRSIDQALVVICVVGESNDYWPHR